MRRAWGWAGVAAVAWLLAALPTPVVALGTAGAILESTYNITALPESCSYLRKDFGSSPIFDYQAGWTSNETIPSYCMLEISYLFLDGACSAWRNTTGDLKGCGREVGGNNASCEAVMRDGRPSWWDGSPSWWSAVRPNAPATTIFDTGAICDDAPSLGYFYLHNSCNLTFSLAVKVIVQPRSSCHPAAGAAAMFKKILILLVYMLIVPLKYILCTIAGMWCITAVIALGILLCYCLSRAVVWVFRSCCCRRPVLPPTVQMAPVGARHAAAKDCTPLLGGRPALAPGPSGLPATKRPGHNLGV